MAFYMISLPILTRPRQEDVGVHSASVCMLCDKSPWILHQFAPVSVGGDDNCPFCAVSYVQYGHGQAYTHLRLLTSTEMLWNRQLYDCSSDNFYMPYAADYRLELSNYATSESQTVANGTYSDTSRFEYTGQLSDVSRVVD